ncbi:MAG TPA: cupin domain-containing protein [Gemmatimonadales bacterium]|jgi:quercetin dioxygenase-like cupin family protein|nr:cupin domain-containing protein [Gemmatimonadales bacterium]
MKAWLGALGVLAVLGGCNRRHGEEVTRSGTDTIIRSSTVKDTTVVHADTSIDVDTVHKTNHIAGAGDSVGGKALEWGPQPPGLPAGARVAVVRGDPSKAGPFTIRVDLPDGYQIKPHWHPTAERLSVVEGSLLMGDGRAWSDKSMRPLQPGQVASLAARHPHYVEANGQTMVEIRSTGPFEITYVNADDDPRKAPIQ